MKVSSNQVSFIVHPSVEFIYSLNFIANEEYLYKLYLDFNFTPSESFRQSIDELKSKLSRFVKNELMYFFNWSDMSNILGRILLEISNVRHVHDFISLLNQMPERELQSYIIYQSLYGLNTDDISCVHWRTGNHTAEDLKKLITDSDHKSDEIKEKLIECVENPSEFKARLCFLLEQYYANCYEPLEEKIISKLSLAVERYEKSFIDNPDYFNNEYLSKALDTDYREFIIHISYFTQIRAWLFEVNTQKRTQFISLGIHSEHYPRKMFIKAKVQKFVKLLSDKKRFEIIEYLGKRPYYVYELSSELKLTPPTVCYHLNTMLDLNIVSTTRENNKTFYALNKASVKELLDNANEILLNSEE